MAIIIKTDGRSRAVLPGRSNERFLLRENSDGSLLLEPVKLVTDAQHEYDSSPELRELLARAVASPTARGSRSPRAT